MVSRAFYALLVANTAAIIQSTTTMVAASSSSSLSHHHRHRGLRISEVEDGSRKAQISLDPLQICLFPTYLSLDKLELQNDMRAAMKRLVSDRLQAEYGDRFEYFDFNDAKDIAWYSGEEEDPVCGDLQGVLPEAAASRVGAQTLSGGMDEGPIPCTCALYPSAVVLMAPGDDAELLTAETMKPKIARTLQVGLVRALQQIASEITYNSNNDGSNKTASPAYFELKAASVSFDVAKRDASGNLVLPPEETEVPTLAPVAAPTFTPVAFVITEAPSASPRTANVAGLEEGRNSLPSSAENNLERYGIIIAIGVAVLLILSCCCLCYLRIRGCLRGCCCRSRSNDEEEDQALDDPSHVNKGASNDVATVIGEEDEDEEVGRRHRSKTVYEQHFGGNASVVSGDDAASAQTEEASEMAQYQRGELLDCVSVASEWTMGTNEDGASYDKSSSSYGNSSRRRVTAELLAAKETFDRNQHISLQKDMLLSEWSATPTTLGPAMDSKDSKRGASGSSNTLSFAQAYKGEGEEVYLMPPGASRKAGRS